MRREAEGQRSVRRTRVFFFPLSTGSNNFFHISIQGGHGRLFPAFRSPASQLAPLFSMAQTRLLAQVRSSCLDGEMKKI